jgi:hypothetical protein
MTASYEGLLARAIAPITSRVRTDVTAMKGSKGSYWTKDALTPQRIEQHVNGGPARGVCPIKEGESVTMLGVLDFDSHQGATPWAEMVATVSSVADVLNAKGHAPIVFRSSGGRGIHLFLLWDTPQDAYSVRAMFIDSLTQVGLHSGAKGVQEKQVEIFPKQDEVRVGEHGNQFILPLAGKSEPLDPLFGYEPMGKEWTAQMSWPSSQSVEPRQRPARVVLASPSSLEPIERVRSALFAIPNDDARRMDYDSWRDTAFAVWEATGGSTEGLEVLNEWSAQFSGHDPKFLEDRVWRYIKPPQNRKTAITRATLFATAYKNGWVERTTVDGLDNVNDAGLSDDDRRSRREQQRAENARLQDVAINTLPPIVSVDMMVDDAVWIAQGSYVGLISNPQQVLSYSDFSGLTAASKTEIKEATEADGEDSAPAAAKPDKRKTQKVLNAALWKNSKDRKTVLTRTFHAGEAAICLDPDGKTALNSWRPIQRWPVRADPGLFLDQVAYLFPDGVERGVFLDWLAHVEQQPGVLPHFGWLHIASETGTGRNWLASVLARVWRGYVAPNVDLPALLESQFNEELAGRVIAIVDEVQEGASENSYKNSNRLKSLINAEYRKINPKGLAQYKEVNAVRWLIFSNHDNALPMNRTERRMRVVRHTAQPRPANDYVQLYAVLSDQEFINAVGMFLRDRDISAFNPGERPPMSEAKKAAINASKSLVMQNAENMVASWPSDIATHAEIAKELSERAGQTFEFTPAMRRALDEIGCVKLERALKVDGHTEKAWVLRNLDTWRDAEHAAQVAEVRRGRALAWGDSQSLFSH